jgi:hypothetical protein
MVQLRAGKHPDLVRGGALAQAISAVVGADLLSS